MSKYDDMSNKTLRMAKARCRALAGCHADRNSAGDGCTSPLNDRENPRWRSARKNSALLGVPGGAAVQGVDDGILFFFLAGLGGLVDNSKHERISQ